MFDRCEPMFGSGGLAKLHRSTVCVVGLGGVGSFAVEALARSGIGKLILVDKDCYEGSNLNRQLGALHSTLNQPKTDVLAARVRDINPDIEVITLQMFYNNETKTELFNHRFDYLFDAIDTVTFKIDLIEECLRRGIPFLTSCGQGNRVDSTKVIVTDIRKTSYDPIAKVMRLKFKKKRIRDKIPCVFSQEVPHKNAYQRTPSSNALVPSVAGITAASYIIQALLKG